MPFNRTIDLTHPIYNSSKFFIQTPMSVGLLETVKGWLWNGSTGGFITGSYRIGKTRAIADLSTKLVNRRNEPIPSRHLTVRKRDVQTIAGIFKNLCFAFGMNVKKSSTADDMSNDAAHFLAELSLANSTNQVVLFVDEMQRLTVHQLEAFAELYDLLSAMGVNLSVIFIGNYHASKDILKQLTNPEFELLRGRFFTQSCRHHGIRNESELRKCLQQFDGTINGHSITQHFAPDLYDAGWRLDDISLEMWRIFNNEFKGNLQIDSWAMQYFIATMKLLLFDYVTKHDVRNPQILEQLIRNSIEASGVAPNLT